MFEVEIGDSFLPASECAYFCSRPKRSASRIVRKTRVNAASEDEKLFPAAACLFLFAYLPFSQRKSISTRMQEQQRLSLRPFNLMSHTLTSTCNVIKVEQQNK